MELSNTQECFVRLWLRLERTRRLLWEQHRRFCIRRVLQMWFGSEADDGLTSSSHLTPGHQQARLHGSRSFDDFIWEVCHRASLALDDGCDPICGWDELPPPSLRPRRHRELLRAIVSVRLGITFGKVDQRALDAAYSIAFPRSTPLNVNKKKKE